jgi:hypothetical protein
MGRAVRSAGRRALKLASSPVLAAARVSGFFGLAQRFLHPDEYLAVLDSSRISAVQLDLAEPARPLTALAAGDPPPALQPVTTAVTILDATSGALAFTENLVVTDRGWIVFSRDVDEDGRPYTFRDLRPWRTPLPSARRVSGSVGYLSNTGVHNFGHWLLFVFPLVQLYREHLGEDPDYYYVGNPIQPWHYDSLAEIGIARERVLTDAVVGDRMVAAIADWPTPAPTPFLDFTTDSLRRTPDPSMPPRRVYISRKLRPTRPLLNEEECLEVLERHGFESWCTETLTLREETQLFADAEVVVGLHGAGLANLVFCHPGCIAVELFAHGFTSTWFTDVCAVRGVTYASLHGRPTVKRGLPGKHYQVLLDTGELDAVLAAATEAAARRR